MQSQLCNNFHNGQLTEEIEIRGIARLLAPFPGAVKLSGPWVRNAVARANSA